MEVRRVLEVFETIVTTRGGCSSWPIPMNRMEFITNETSFSPQKMVFTDQELYDRVAWRIILNPGVEMY